MSLLGLSSTHLAQSVEDLVEMDQNLAFANLRTVLQRESPRKIACSHIVETFTGVVAQPTLRILETR